MGPASIRKKKRKLIYRTSDTGKHFVSMHVLDEAHMTPRSTFTTVTLSVNFEVWWFLYAHSKSWVYIGSI